MVSYVIPMQQLFFFVPFGCAFSPSQNPYIVCFLLLPTWLNCFFTFPHSHIGVKIERVQYTPCIFILVVRAPYRYIRTKYVSLPAFPLKTSP